MAAIGWRYWGRIVEEGVAFDFAALGTQHHILSFGLVQWGEQMPL